MILIRIMRIKNTKLWVKHMQLAERNRKEQVQVADVLQKFQLPLIATKKMMTTDRMKVHTSIYI